MQRATLDQFLESWDAVDNLELALEIAHGARLPSGYSLHDFIGSLQMHMGPIKVGTTVYKFTMGGLSSLFFYNYDDQVLSIINQSTLMYSMIDDIIVTDYRRGYPMSFNVVTIDGNVAIKLI